MLKAVLTGGIATGKSYVRQQFERLGAACLDSDLIAHGVMAAGTEATQAIASRFGDRVLASDGSVNRTVLGSLVFADPAARRDLEAIVHPAIYRGIHAAIRGLGASERPAVVIVEIPLIYETGRAGEFDRVIATLCSETRQIERLMERRLTEDQARQRLSAQWPAADKAKRADYVITTDGSFEETDSQVAAVWQKLRQASTSFTS